MSSWTREETLLRWKNALNHDYKNNSGRNFRFTKSSFIDFVLTDRRSLSGKRPKSAGGTSGCRFSYSDERSANTKATEYATFYIWLSLNVLGNWWNNSLFRLVRVMRRQQANAKDLLIEELICESHLRSCKWTERSDASQNSRKLSCSLRWFYERLSLRF